MNAPFVHSAPVLRIALPFALGAGVALYFESGKAEALAAFALAMLAFVGLVLGRKSWAQMESNHYFGVLASIAFFALAFSYASYRLDAVKDRGKFSGLESAFEAVLLRSPQEKANSTSLLIRLHALKTGDEKPWIRSNARLMAYAHPSLRADTLQAGDVLRFASLPRAPERSRNPAQFDYGKYLLLQGISATVYIPDDLSVHRPTGGFSDLVVYLERWRERAIGLFRQYGWSGTELELVSALVLGQRDAVSPELREAYTTAGTVHILAVSGLHVGIIYLMISYLLRFVLPGDRLRFYKLLLSLIGLWLYAGISGFSPSVLRAATMFSFIALGKHYGRMGNVFNMLGASALILLLVNPFLIASAGFQLSYLAVSGIVIIYPLLYPKWVPSNVLLDKIWALTAVSIAAQVATLPLSLYYFHQFPNYFLLSNLAIIPLATALLHAGIACLLLYWIPYVGDLIMLASQYLARFLNEVVMLFSKLPAPVSDGFYLSTGEMAVAYAGFFAFGVIIIRPSPRHFRGFWLCLLLWVALFAARQAMAVASQESYILHSRNSTAIIASRGSKAAIFSFSGRASQSEDLNYVLEPYLLSRGIRDTVHFRQHAYMRVGQHSISIARTKEEFIRSMALRPDFIICHGGWSVYSDTLPQLAPGTQVVIDASVPPYRMERMESWLRSAGLEVHNTSRRGAIRF